MRIRYTKDGDMIRENDILAPITTCPVCNFDYAVGEEHICEIKPCGQFNAEEVCEWKMEYEGGAYDKYSTTHGSKYCVNIEKWNYCPYCGKKIKGV